MKGHPQPIQPLFVFELYLRGQLVGTENHGVDPDLPSNYIGIYHKPLDSSLIFGHPVTLGDKCYIFHDKKVLIHQP